MRLASCALVASVMVVPLMGQERIPDTPSRRWEDFYRRRAFPFDAIPPGALQQARLQVAASQAAGQMAPPPISGSQWQSIGPEAIPIFGTSIGRISAIAVDPTDSNIVYIGGAQGGVWKTTNQGASWTPLTDGECSLAMGSIAIDPVNPQIVYAATGEQHFSGDSYYGCGVLRSEDGGGTWTQLGASLFAATGSSARISRVAVAPSTSGTVATTTLLVAADNGLYRSLNGGNTFSLVLSGTATDLVVHPANDSIMWAAVRFNGIYKSTNRGATWTQLGGGLPGSGFRRVNLGIAASGPDTIYAAFESTSAQSLGQLLGIWRTGNGGTTWTQLTASTASCGNQCWYDLHITVHPLSADTVFLGGVSLYRSINGGAAFANVTAGIHVDQHFMAFDPQNPKVVYAANDGGVYRSTNGGTSWTSINAGLSLTQFYEGISLHPSIETIILGGTQDNGTLQYGGAMPWEHVLGGDGGYTAINQDNPAIRYAETQWSNTFGGPRRSVNGGFYQQVVNGIDLNDQAQFIPPLVMDPVRSSILYFGTTRIYRTTNGGDSWTDLSGILGGGTITAIAPSASNPQAIYAGASNGGVFVSADGGASWPGGTAGLPVRYIQDIAVDRADWQTAYVVVSGFGSGHVFRTTNGGQTWTDRSGNLPDVPVNAVITDPVDRGIVMIGTDLGVWISADSGGTWTQLQQGLPNVAVFDIAYNPATGALIAATHGRGMFQLQLNRPLTLAVVPGGRGDSVDVGSVTPFADSAAVVLSGVGAGGAGWNAATGSTWITLTAAAGTGSGTIRWTVNPTGLTQGTWVDTIIVTSAGAADSPFPVPVTLEVQGSLALALSATSRVDSALAGTTAPVFDSVDVVLSGSGAGGASWTATAGAASWITFTSSAGSGPGTVRWRRSAASLAPGLHVATITVTVPGAAGGPVALADSFVVLPPPAVFSATTIVGQGTSGASGTVAGAVALILAGGTDSTTPWTATHGGSGWLTLTTTAGTGTDSVRWARSAFDLLPAAWRDTITVVTSAGDTLRVVDLFNVGAPATAAQCAADHLLGVPCLDPTQLRWLDLAGNEDGTFNLGDFLAFRDRGGNAPPAAPGAGRIP